MEWVINIPIIYIQVAILLVSMVSIAQAGGVVSISDVALDPGDNITIPITIYGATGVAAVGLNLSYDPCVVNIIDTHQGHNRKFQWKHSDFMVMCTCSNIRAIRVIRCHS